MQVSEHVRVQTVRIIAFVRVSGLVGECVCEDMGRKKIEDWWLSVANNGFSVDVNSANKKKNQVIFEITYTF